MIEPELVYGVFLELGHTAEPLQHGSADAALDQEENRPGQDGQGHHQPEQFHAARPGQIPGPEKLQNKPQDQAGNADQRHHLEVGRHDQQRCSGNQPDRTTPDARPIGERGLDQDDGDDEARHLDGVEPDEGGEFDDERRAKQQDRRHPGRQRAGSPAHPDEKHRYEDGVGEHRRHPRHGHALAEQPEERGDQQREQAGTVVFAFGDRESDRSPAILARRERGTVRRIPADGRSWRHRSAGRPQRTRRARRSR